MIYLDYKDVLSKTNEVVDEIVKFIGVEMDKEAMVACVDKSLYRTKSDSNKKIKKQL